MSYPTKKLGEIFEPIFVGVEKDTLDRMKDGDKREEDHITGDILTRIEERVNGHDFNGLRVRARQFSGRGPNSDESLTGADGALIVEAPDLELRKFFIFQAKKQTKFDERAIEQKWRMLACTPDSFFLVYGKKQFQFVSAFLVSVNDKLGDLPTKSFSELHKDFFNCFIGDHFFGFPPLPFHRPWRFWPFWDEFRDFAKFPKDLPLAKKNLLIQINKHEK
ncbi:MAG: hypothetical protein HYT27_02010 [Parcubacteria group bacterium]|nr:hypothetical protein [Parcubacteria group bacterium]